MLTFLRLFIYLLVFSFLSACGSKRRTTYYVPHLNPVEESQKLLDSLQTNGVDTLVLYEDGCHGCMEGIEESIYVFWRKKNQNYICLFTNYSNYFPREIHYFPLYFIVNHATKIHGDTLLDPQFGLFHYDFERVLINIGKTRFEFRVDEFEKEANPLNFKVLTIDKIRSSLLDIPLLQSRPKHLKKGS
jgi:hypothetical protein